MVMIDVAVPESWYNAMATARRKRAHTGVKYVVRGMRWQYLGWRYYALPIGQQADNRLLRERRQAASAR